MFLISIYRLQFLEHETTYSMPAVQTADVLASIVLYVLCCK